MTLFNQMGTPGSATETAAVPCYFHNYYTANSTRISWTYFLHIILHGDKHLWVGQLTSFIVTGSLPLNVGKVLFQICSHWAN